MEPPVWEESKHFLMSNPSSFGFKDALSFHLYYFVDQLGGWSNQLPMNTLF
jgi:hypothetical protein